MTKMMMMINLFNLELVKFCRDLSAEIKNNFRKFVVILITYIYFCLPSSLQILEFTSGLQKYLSLPFS